MNLKDAAIRYNEAFGFNILPLNNKVPAGDWICWQKKLQTVNDISIQNWHNINGIGSVSGINNIRCLDFDNVTDVTIINEFMQCLGLHSQYEWTVCSGSGKGYHIWFYCSDDINLFQMLGGEKSYYKLKVDNRCDHIELRWKNCQTVLPPSLHPSGKAYKFLYNGHGSMPLIPPAKIKADQLIKTLQINCQIDPILKPLVVEPEQRPAADSKLKRVSEYLSGRINNYDDWMRMGFALASLGEEGRKYFIDISSNNPNYPDTAEQLNAKYDGLLKDYRGDIKIGTLYEIARRYGFHELYQNFWKIEENKVIIFPHHIIKFLKSEGFAKMIIHKDFIFIRSTDNIISEVSKINIKDYLLEHIYKSTNGLERELLEAHFIKNAGSLCGETTLECLPTMNPTIVSGSKEKEYFFFKNCFIEVTSEQIKQLHYNRLDGKIWERQKASHDFYFTEVKSEFEIFIENICRKDPERTNALKSAIGYLLVSYKDPASAKAIIFIDEKLSDNAFGRSGKGLVSKAITQMKNVLKIDGKNFTFERSFMFQAVDQDTQLIIFDDVRKKFSFEKLFSILTEGITIEKKNKNEYRVPYERSPKILITTNHTVEGSDDSSIDRQFVVEFSDYYNAQNKPSDEFGHLFFDEWNEEQWTAFYNYMAGCCKYYLKNGLKNYEYVNLTKKKLIDSTAPEFEEFITELKLDVVYNRKELFERFKKEYEDFGQMKHQTLSKWTGIYANLYNLDLEIRKSGQERFIRFRRKAQNELKSNKVTKQHSK